MNPWFWRHLLRREILSREDIFVLGIGTILGGLLEADVQKGLKSGIVIVAGSGYGYPRKENSIIANSGKIDFRFVRGPHSADILALSSTKALSDPALITSTLAPNLKKDSHPNNTVFVPHVFTAVQGRWRKPTLDAGIEYIDPRANHLKVFREIANSSLVIAESLHAAIIADSYRVPWIPFVTSRHFHSFKWLDWTRSINKRFYPQKAHCASSVTTIAPSTRKFQSHKIGSESVSIAKKVRRKAIETLQQINDAAFGSQFSSMASADLEFAARQEPQLSEDSIFDQKCAEIMERIETLNTEYG